MPLSAEDRLEILELAARYNHAFDSMDAEGWANVFTPDAVFDVIGALQVSGHDALVEFGRAQQTGVTRHFVSNAVIQGDADTATMQLYVELKTLGEQPSTTLLGRYEDELRRIDGAWRFARRTLTTDYSNFPAPPD